jgi:hypothetical protein
MVSSVSVGGSNMHTLKISPKKGQSSENNLQRVLTLIGTLVIVVYVVYGYMIYSHFKEETTISTSAWERRGQYGDMFGAINTLFSGGAFIGIIYAIFLQRKDLKVQLDALNMQFEELQLTRSEHKRSADTQAEQLKALLAQLNQTSSIYLTSLSNQHNWDLLDKHEHLPPALPSWVGISYTQRAWRVLHLNHLNLIKLAFDNYNADTTKKEELGTWILKARYWFQHLKPDDQETDIQEGYKMLKQVLSSEESCYSREFCKWLVESRIIPADLLEDS